MDQAIALVRDRGAESVQITLRWFGIFTTSWDQFDSEWLRPHRVAAVVAAPSPQQSRRDLRRFREQCGKLPVLLLLPAECIAGEPSPSAQTCDDFLILPVREDELRARITRLIGRASAAGEARDSVPEVSRAIEKLLPEFTTGLVGKAPLFREQMRRLHLIAKSRAPVLITGETGTGKERCARAIHSLSTVRDGPIVVVDCASVPDHLLDNELFGHARGAYTDAHATQKGLIAMADGGTLFIDEVDALSLAGQSRLLRFLEDRTYRPLGSDRFCRSEARILVASNKDLEEWSGSGRFRLDLFHRLNVLRLELPALRDRPDDILPLATHFLDQIAHETGLPIRGLTPSATARLSAHAWPGNVRELRNTLYRASLLCDADVIDSNDLPFRAQAETDPADSAADYQSAKARALEKFEKEYVTRLLLQHGGNVTQAARSAGKERRAFGRVAKKHGLTGS